MTEPQRYPLDWPVGEPRTSEWARSKSPFKVDFAIARDELLSELHKLGATGVVISSNLRTRADGIPYADAPKRLADPGVAVYWTIRKYDAAAKRDVATPFVMTCDRYQSTHANIRAIGLSVAALRALERHGTKAIRDRAFQGFAALPAKASPSSWRAALGFGPDERPTLEEIDRRYKRALLSAHPDRGGSTEKMSAITNARDDARREIAGNGART